MNNDKASNKQFAADDVPPVPGTTTAAYRMWRASGVSQWLLGQAPSELTRACLRGILPRLDPRVADLIFQTVAEQLAVVALAQAHEAEAEMKVEEAAREARPKICNESHRDSRGLMSFCALNLGHAGSHRDVIWLEDGLVTQEGVLTDAGLRAPDSMVDPGDPAA